MSEAGSPEAIKKMTFDLIFVRALSGKRHRLNFETYQNDTIIFFCQIIVKKIFLSVGKNNDWDYCSARYTDKTKICSIVQACSVNTKCNQGQNDLCMS